MKQKVIKLIHTRGDAIIYNLYQFVPHSRYNWGVSKCPGSARYR